MKKLTTMDSRALLGAGAAGIAVLLVAWWMVLMSPAGHKLSALHTQQQTLEGTAQSLQGQLTTLKNQKAHSTTLEALAARNQAAMPTGPGLPDFINEMNALAGATGVDMSALSPSPPAAGGSAGATAAKPYQTMAVSISFKGTYGQVMAFLQGLYALPRLVVVNSVSLSGGGPAANPGTVLTGAVQAQIFTRPATAAPATVAPAAVVAAK